VIDLNELERIRAWHAGQQPTDDNPAWKNNHHELGVVLGMAAELVALAALRDNQIECFLAHCPDGECPTCSQIICPHGCELHFHHDGCPACAEHEGNQ
jgi:hypothetical protein